MHIRLLWLLFVLVAIGAGCSATTSTTTVPSSENVMDGAYLMAFHACDGAKAECNNPRAHEVYLAQSNDGVAWEVVPGWQSYTGSVPDVIRRENTIYVYTPNSVVRCSLTAVCSAPEAVRISGLSAGFVDPSLTMNDDGQLVLFFLYGEKGADPAQCPSGQTTCIKRIGSATEVDGSNGTQFVLDEGDRATITLNANELRSASDPDIFFDGTQYVLYVSHGSSIAVWTSSNLQGTYTRVNSSYLSKNTGGIPSGFFDNATGRYWTYAHTKAQNGVSVIRRATHTTLTKQLAESDWQAVLSADDIGLNATVNVESPSFARNVP